MPKDYMFANTLEIRFPLHCIKLTFFNFFLTLIPAGLFRFDVMKTIAPIASKRRVDKVVVRWVSHKYNQPRLGCDIYTVVGVTSSYEPGYHILIVTSGTILVITCARDLAPSVV